MNLKKSILQSWLMESIIEKMSSDLEICFPLQLHKRKISSLIFKQELCSWLYFSKFMCCRNTRLGFDHVMTTKFAIFNLGILTPSLSSFEWKGESECHSRSKGVPPTLHLIKKKKCLSSMFNSGDFLFWNSTPNLPSPNFFRYCTGCLPNLCWYSTECPRPQTGEEEEELEEEERRLRGTSEWNWRRTTRTREELEEKLERNWRRICWGNWRSRRGTLEELEGNGEELNCFNWSIG